MLKRIFSETDLLLENVDFRPGVNIILGKYSGDKDARGVNGIGKSTLVRLIDFALLSDIAERKFSAGKYDFLRKENHNVILEFNVQNKVYYVKRTFADTTKAFFGENLRGLEEIYTNIQVVNYTIAERLRAATKSDSVLNGLVELDIFAQTLSLVIEDSLEDIRFLFDSYLNTVK